MKRNFGSLGWEVSEIGLGCWALGGNQFGNSYGSTDDVVSLKTIKKAVELGCDFFDTADVYGHGHSEELLGLALHKVREKVRIATKVGGAYIYGSWGSMNFSDEYIRFALEKSLQRLRTDYIDLYQLHNPPLNIIKEGSVFQTLKDLKKEGKIRAFGISIHSLEEGQAAIKKGIDSIQCVFNLLDPKMYEIIEAAKRMGVAVIAREPLCNGFLTEKFSGIPVFEEGDIRARFPVHYIQELIYSVETFKEALKREEPMAQLALKYVLSFDSVSVVMPGAKTPEQVEQNLKASKIPNLTQEELDRLGS